MNTNSTSRSKAKFFAGSTAQPGSAVNVAVSSRSNSATSGLDKTIASDSVDKLFPSRTWAIVIGVLCVTAIGISGYLFWVALTSSKVAGCGGGHIFDCNDVINSRWSRWLGIPVSGLALGLYATLLGAVIAGCRTRASASVRRIAWAVGIVLGLSAGIAAIWFISLQLFVVKHLCTYCLSAHSCGLIISAILLWKRPLGGKMLKNLSLLSVFGIGILVAGQMLVKPVTYKVIEHQVPATKQDSSEADVFEFSPGSQAQDDSNETINDAEKREPIKDPKIDQSQSSLFDSNVWHLNLIALLHPTSLLQSSGGSVNTPVQDDAAETPATVKSEKDQPTTKKNEKKSTPARRLVSMSGGTIKLDVAQWPLIGKPTAKYIFVEMFDYTCDHCRRTHAAIEGAKKQLGDDLAVVALAIPLNTNCNSAITTTGPRMAEACEIAQLAIAVWRVDESRFGEFHDYLMKTPIVVTNAEARTRAAELVGEEKLNTELSKPVVNQYIAQQVELYRRVGAGNVPKLLFPGTTVVGEFTSADNLLEIIKQQGN